VRARERARVRVCRINLLRVIENLNFQYLKTLIQIRKKGYLVQNVFESMISIDLINRKNF